MSINIIKKSITATGTTVENEPIIKSDGAGEVMQWQPSDGAADGIFITENSAGDALRLGVGVSPVGQLQVKVASNVNLSVSHNSGATRLNAVNDAADANVPMELTASSYKFIGGNVAINDDNYYQWGGTNARIVGSHSGDYVKILTGNSAKLTVDSAGNVGFKTSSPSSFYSLADDIVIGSGSGGRGLTIYSGTDSSGYIGFNDTASASMQGFIQYNHDGDYMAFAPNGTEKMRISSAGTTTITATGDVQSIVCDSTAVTKNALQISADSLTTGRAAYFYSNSADTSTRQLVRILNDNPLSTGTTCLEVRNDSTGPAISTIGGIVEKNGVLRSNILSNSGFDVWSNSTLEVVSTPFSDADGSSHASWVSTRGTMTDAGANLLFSRDSGTDQDTKFTLSGLTAGKLYKATLVTANGTLSWGASDFFAAIKNAGGTLDINHDLSAGSHTVTWEASGADDKLMIQTNMAGAGNLVITSVKVEEVTPGFVNGTPSCDGWATEGTTAHGKQYRQQDTFTKDGSFYSFKFISHATADNSVYQVPFSSRSNSTTMSSPEVLARVAGRTVTFGAWVYSASGAADDVAVFISDSERGYATSQHDASAFHTAATGWEWLEVTHTFGASPAAATVGFYFDAGTTTSYMSQPMLVFGSAIGSGNYSRPSGEVIWCENEVASNLLNNTTGHSDVDWTALNVEADSNGKIPKGAKAVAMQIRLNDSASSSGGEANVQLGAYTDGNNRQWSADILGIADDKPQRRNGWIPCNSTGDPDYNISASGSGTLDIPLAHYYGVELR